ncbi:MAG: M55 family metallopeptidase [Patescibacteria group bacterium]
MKKLLIVSDMEGIAGIPMNQFWATVPGHPLYFFKRRLLIKEIKASIRGAVRAGLKPEEIVVLDWHSTHHNFSQKEMPEGVTVIQKGETDFLKSGTIEKVFLIGFHAKAEISVPIAHSMRYTIKTLKIKGKSIGEASLWAYVAGSMNIPITLMTGDNFAVSEIRSLDMQTICIETKNEKETPRPEDIYKKIEIAAEKAIHKTVLPLSTPSPFSISFSFKSARLGEEMPEKYFTRREGEHIIIEGKTAADVYDDFRDRVYAYIKTINPLRLIHAYSQIWKFDD